MDTEPSSLIDLTSVPAAVAKPGWRPRIGDTLIGESLAMHRLRQQIEPCTASSYPVLIQGESGTGKELVASYIRAQGPRRTRPYLVLNCAALAPGLIETMLFGHVKGAFTGAASGHTGYFEAAADGTLFLDEVGELPQEAQSKLLRVLESGEYQRVGETCTQTARARILSATNRDLRADVRNGRFRADLYHRLSVFNLHVPPLRERGEDKLALLHHFALACARENGAAPLRLDRRAEALWLAHPFPGNVRELRNVVIRLSAHHPGQIVDHARLKAELSEPPAECDGLGPTTLSIEAARAHLLAHHRVDLDRMLAGWERAFVEAALVLTGHNLTQAARLLGVRRTTLYSRMQHFQTCDTPE